MAPRTAVEVRYRSPLRFNDEVEVELTVTRAAATTIEYSFPARGPERVAPEGKIAACVVDPATLLPTRIPADLRHRLRTSGPLEG